MDLDIGVWIHVGVRMRNLQTLVDNWIKNESITKDYWKDPKSIFLRLVEEVGELSKEINKEYGEKHKKDSDLKTSIPDELSDVFFTTICLANKLNIDLERELMKTLGKYSKRKIIKEDLK